MKKYKKHIILVSLIIVSSILFIYGFSFAKYVSNSIWDYYLRSKGFYFSSDQLDINTVKNVDNLWNGESVYFNIKNSLNQSVITNYDINYDILCTIEGEEASYSECHINGTSSNTQNGVLTSYQTCVNNTTDGQVVSAYSKAQCELGGYDWVNQVATKDLYFNVVLTDEAHEISDVTVNVKVTSTYPYRKVMNGEFKLHRTYALENSVKLDYKNYSNYDRLIISNSYSSNKCVKVSWNSDNLLINEKLSEFSSYETDASGYVNGIKFNINAKNSLSYIFYKRNVNQIYSVSDFSIEESSGC